MNNDRRRVSVILLASLTICSDCCDGGTRVGRSRFQKFLSHWIDRVGDRQGWGLGAFGAITAGLRQCSLGSMGDGLASKNRNGQCIPRLAKEVRPLKFEWLSEWSGSSVYTQPVCPAPRLSCFVQELAIRVIPMPSQPCSTKQWMVVERTLYRVADVLCIPSFSVTDVPVSLSFGAHKSVPRSDTDTSFRVPVIVIHRSGAHKRLAALPRHLGRFSLDGCRLLLKLLLLIYAAHSL